MKIIINLLYINKKHSSPQFKVSKELIEINQSIFDLLENVRQHEHKTSSASGKSQLKTILIKNNDHHS